MHYVWVNTSTKKKLSHPSPTLSCPKEAREVIEKTIGTSAIYWRALEHLTSRTNPELLNEWLLNRCISLKIIKWPVT